MTKILVDGQEHDIEAKQITILAHQGGLHIEVPNYVEINSEVTVARARALSDYDWRALCRSPEFCWAFEKVIGSKPPITPPYPHSLDSLHFVGMLLMLYETMAAGKQPFLRCPETYLHPRSCAELTDILVGISQGKSLKEMRESETASKVARRMER